MPCLDDLFATFVVEMQLIHHPGFINRVVYNASKAYAAIADKTACGMRSSLMELESH